MMMNYMNPLATYMKAMRSMQDLQKQKVRNLYHFGNLLWATSKSCPPHNFIDNAIKKQMKNDRFPPESGLIFCHFYRLLHICPYNPCNNSSQTRSSYVPQYAHAYLQPDSLPLYPVSDHNR